MGSIPAIFEITYNKPLKYKKNVTIKTFFQTKTIKKITNRKTYTLSNLLSPKFIQKKLQKRKYRTNSLIIPSKQLLPKPNTTHHYSINTKNLPNLKYRSNYPLFTQYKGILSKPFYSTNNNNTIFIKYNSLTEKILNINYFYLLSLVSSSFYLEGIKTKETPVLMSKPYTTYMYVKFLFSNNLLSNKVYGSSSALTNYNNKILNQTKNTYLYKNSLSSDVHLRTKLDTNSFLSTLFIANSTGSSIQNITKTDWYTRHSDVYLTNSSQHKQLNTALNKYKLSDSPSTSLPPLNTRKLVLYKKSKQVPNKFLYSFTAGMYSSKYSLHLYKTLNKNTLKYLKYSHLSLITPLSAVKAAQKRATNYKNSSTGLNKVLSKKILQLYTKLKGTENLLFTKPKNKLNNNYVVKSTMLSLSSKKYKNTKTYLNKTLTKVLDPKVFFLRNRFSLFFKKKPFSKKINQLKNITNKGGLVSYYYRGDDSTSFKNFINTKGSVLNTFYNFKCLKNTTTCNQKSLIPTIYTLKTFKSNNYITLFMLLNPTLIPLIITNKRGINQLVTLFSNNINTYINKTTPYNTNLLPSKYFSFLLTKNVYTSMSQDKISKNIIPIYHHTLIRFMENLSGNLILLQFYPFVNQSITTDFIIKYKL